MKNVLIGPVPPFRRGISHHNSNLIEALISTGHKVLSITFLRLYPKFFYPGKDDKNLSQTTTFNSEPIIGKLNPFTWIKCFKRISEFNSDKVIFPLWPSYFVFFFYFISLLLERNLPRSLYFTQSLSSRTKMV